MYCFVTIKMDTPYAISNAFLSGNTKNLGCWQEDKSLPMKKTGDTYRLKKRFSVGENVEFKIMEKKDWGNVEKGCFFEEIANHKFTASSALEVDVHVFNWAQGK